jgi:MoxR-like ATPase
LAIELGIVKAGGGCVGLSGGEPDLIEAGPEDGAEAHGAGLATGVDFAAGEVVVLQGGGGVADGGDLGVGGGVKGGRDEIDAFGEELSVADDDGAEGPAAGGDVGGGERDGAAEPVGGAGGVGHLIVMIGKMSDRELQAGSITTTAAPGAGRLEALTQRLEGSLRGKAEVVRLSLACLLARGHLLIEDVPGVGKTTLANALAHAVDCGFHRLQFTADMLPADVTGVSVFNAHTREFEFKPGPVFTNFLLADEINRATPKTQSALLEAMNEGQVSVDGETHPLSRPFMVLATQNPLEHHGTYPLPESQLDRFLMRLRIGYPDTASEREILKRGPADPQIHAPAILTGQDVLELQEQVEQVSVDEAIVDYILGIVDRTRHHESLTLGVSPRGAQALYRAAQAMALIDGRGYATPDDVKRVAVPVCAHRVAMSTRVAAAQRTASAAERIVEEILTLTEVPL